MVSQRRGVQGVVTGKPPTSLDTGLPGSGKTVLSSQIIATLLGQQDQSRSLPPMYFFFDTRDGDKQTLDDVLRSLVSQLSFLSNEAMETLNNFFAEKYDGGNRRPSSQDLAAMFLAMLRSQRKKVRIVIDALDECTTQDEVLVWMQSLTTEFTDVATLITSRDETRIESVIRE